MATEGMNSALAYWIRQQQIVAEEATQVRTFPEPSEEGLGLQPQLHTGMIVL